MRVLPASKTPGSTPNPLPIFLAVGLCRVRGGVRRVKNEEGPGAYAATGCASS